MNTFAFADLAGFTALTEAHGDETAADVAQRFAERVADVLPEGAELVKTIGDAVMLRFVDAPSAVRMGLLVSGGGLGDGASPAVRVGMHTGSAVQRGTDWFGEAVNIAARVAGQARGGETLLSDTTKQQSTGLADVIFDRLGPVELHNVRTPVQLWRVRRVDPGRTAPIIDPVCRMAVDPSKGVGTLEHGGTRYTFCSLTCAALFATDPERYSD